MSEKIILLLPSAIIALIALIATIWFNVSANKRENHKIMKELFVDFNHRYSKLNSKLEAFVEANEGKNEIIETELASRDNIIDYFNLCAEQFFWYERGRIDPELWLSWNNGMNYWYKFECIKSLWKEQTQDRKGKLSYYIKNGNEFFHD